MTTNYDSSRTYYNNLVSLNDVFYSSHRALLERACVLLNVVDRVDELVEALLEQPKLKPRKDPNRPKRNQNAYNFFCREHRAVVRKAHGGKPVPFGVMNKTLGEAWSTLSEKKRQKYVKSAAQDKERYQADMEEYNQSLGVMA